MNASRRAPRALVLLLAASIAAAPALAAPPPWAGGGKHAAQEHEEHGGKPHKAGKDEERGPGQGGKGKAARKAPAPGAYFDNGSREAVRTYYSAHPPRPCPPGLAKKNNGCLPPGQAKKWHVGQPLPRDVVYVPAPRQLLVQLPPVPAGHRYVQVAGDILLIAVGSRMVVDGINGLMSR